MCDTIIGHEQIWSIPQSKIPILYLLKFNPSQALIHLFTCPLRIQWS
jgi:hypothetical protein